MSASIEELVLVAALVAVSEHAHQPPRRICPIGILLRWSFHVYHGNLGWEMLSTLPLALWAAAAIRPLRWTRRISPLIAVHIAWDLQVDLLSTADQPLMALSMLLLLGIALLAWVVGLVTRRRSASSTATGHLLCQRQAVFVCAANKGDGRRTYDVGRPNRHMIPSTADPSGRCNCFEGEQSPTPARAAGSVRWHIHGTHQRQTPLNADHC